MGRSPSLQRPGGKALGEYLISTGEVSPYQLGTLVELPPYAIKDSRGTGVGDLRGLTDTLPFWQAQGHTAVWLTPFNPSGGDDDGYDPTDHRAVDPRYGTLDDFDRLVRHAHRLGLRVMVDIVTCHVSRRHKRFKEAQRDPFGPAGEWFIWSHEPDRYLSYVHEGVKHEVPNIMAVDPNPHMVRDKDGDLVAARNWTFDPVANAWYLHPFKPSQPALNYRNKKVRDWMLDNFRFWARRGVDEFRVDAWPFTWHEDGHRGSGHPMVHKVAREYNRALTEEFPGLCLLVEADGTEYLGADQFHVTCGFLEREALFLDHALGDATELVEHLGRRPDLPPRCTRLNVVDTHDDTRQEHKGESARLRQVILQRHYGDGARGERFLGDAVVGGFPDMLDHDRRAMEAMVIQQMLLPGISLEYYRRSAGLAHHRELVRVGDKRKALRTPMPWDDSPSGGFSSAPMDQWYAGFADDPTYINVQSKLDDADSFLHFQRLVNHAVLENPLLNLGRLSLLQASDHTQGWGCVRHWDFDDTGILGVVNVTNKPYHVDSTLPEELRGRFSGAALTNVLTGKAAGQLSGDRVKYRLPAYGYFVARLQPKT